MEALMSEQLPPTYPQNGGYMNPPPTANQQPVKPRHTGVITMVAMVALIFAIMVILNESMLKIRRVAVIGNRQVSWEDVIRAAGLDRPTSYFTVSEEKIKQNISASRYLVFERMEKEFPSGLTLYVHERKPIARVQEMGSVYVIDEEGMVLERLTSSQDSQYDGLMFITGLKSKEMRVGQIMQPGSTLQTEAFKALMQEVILQGITSEISELNMSDPESLYLITTDKFTAHLGDTAYLRAKVGTVRAVIDYLRKDGSGGGMLEAAIPGEVVYSPLSPVREGIGIRE